MESEIKEKLQALLDIIDRDLSLNNIEDEIDYNILTFKEE